MHLTHNECTILRGLAILAIVLHNWTHWLSFAVKENEYTFSMHNVQRLFFELQHPDNDLLIHILSFFGHYGVPLFLFLSGYGLVLKYEKTTTLPTPDAHTPHHSISFLSVSHSKKDSPLSFITTHFVKLFRMMIIGYVLFIIFNAVMKQIYRPDFEHVIAQLTMVNNLFPHPDRIITPGPYWFFGLMLQLYIIYRVILYRRSDSIAITLIIITWLIQALLPISEKETLNYLRYNCVGSILPFVTGILAARHGLPRLNKTTAALTLLITIPLIVFGSLTYQAWLWVPVAVIIAGIALVKLLPQRIHMPFIWTGTISAALFVVHPTLRIIFLPAKHTQQPYTTLLIFLITSLLAAYIMTPWLNRKK